MKKWVSFVFLLFFVLFSNECFLKSKKVYKVGVITNILAPNSYVGLFGISALSDSISLYVQDKFQIYSEDDSWSPSKIGIAFLDIDRVKPDFLVLITTSTSVLEIKQNLEKQSYPVFSLSATTMKIAETDDNIYSFIPNVKEEQEKIAEYFNKNAIDEIFIIKENKNISYTDPALYEFRRRYKGRVLSIYPYETSMLDISSIEEFLKNISHFDVKGIYLLIGFSYDVGIIVQLIRKYFPDDIPVILTPWGGEAGVEAVESGAGKVVVPTFFDLTDENKRAVKWFKKFYKKYGRKPTLSAFLSSEAGCIIGRILERKKSEMVINRSNFVRFLNENKDCFFEDVKISKYGDVKRKMFFPTIDDIIKIENETTEKE